MPTTKIPRILFPRNASVLVVDDDAELLDTVADSLATLLAPARVLKAESAAEALSIFRREPIDLVVADYFMPGDNGLTFLSEVRKMRNRVACILMTGYPRLSMRVKGKQDDAYVAFITKPFEIEEFSKKLQDLLARRTTVRLDASAQDS